MIIIIIIILHNAWFSLFTSSPSSFCRVESLHRGSLTVQLSQWSRWHIVCVRINREYKSKIVHFDQYSEIRVFAVRKTAGMGWDVGIPTSVDEW